MEEQDGVGLSLRAKRTAEVHECSGRSIEAEAVRTDAAWMMYRDGRDWSWYSSCDESRRFNSNQFHQKNYLSAGRHR